MKLNTLMGLERERERDVQRSENAESVFIEWSRGEDDLCSLSFFHLTSFFFFFLLLSINS